VTRLDVVVEGRNEFLRIYLCCTIQVMSCFYKSCMLVCYVLVKFELCALLQMTDDIAKISKDYIFVIPPYFALILRAFSVLEGIGLEVLLMPVIHTFPSGCLRMTGE
jgi:hypothetical protein